MPRFLIIQTAFIGDVVLATPLIEKLHARFPDAKIDFLLRKGNESLLERHPYLHALMIWDKKKHKKRNLLGLIRQIRRNRYDKVINLQRFAATGLMTVLSGAGETIGFDKNPLSFLFSRSIPHLVGGAGQGHETQRNLDLIRHFTDPDYFRPVLHPPPEDLAFARSFAGGKYITVSPASVWFTKQYPPDQWASFIRQIPAGYQVVLLGGPGDHALCEQVRLSAAVEGMKNLAGQLSFLQSAALMSGASMNYVNDSAPMHFASAMNAPVTAVYCSTIPEFGFGPLSDESHIVQRPGTLYCRPCGLHGRSACPELHFRCAREILDEQLLKTLPSAS